VTPDERVVVAGTSLDTPDFALARYAAGPALRCAATPRVGCRAPTKAGAAQLALDRRHGTRNVKWKWRHGAATSLAELGDPTVSQDYALCVYDESGPTPALALENVAPAGGLCDGVPCWRATGTHAFTYGDKPAAPLGITSLKLSSGSDGHASIAVAAKGPNVPTLPLPAPLPLRVQMQSTSGTCWEAAFSAAGTSAQQHVDRFKGKSD
jgi:hypothetical protein